MLIDEAVKGMRGAPANHARLIVRLVRKKPQTLKLVTLKSEENGSVTLWTPEQTPARITRDDRRLHWVVLNTDLVTEDDHLTTYTAALLQAAAECAGREMTDEAALREARRRSRRKQHGPFIL